MAASESTSVDLFRTNIPPAQKMKFSVKDCFSKSEKNQIRDKLQIYSQLLKNSFTENFIFCAAPVFRILSSILKQ